MHLACGVLHAARRMPADCTLCVFRQLCAGRGRNRRRRRRPGQLGGREAILRRRPEWQAPLGRRRCRRLRRVARHLEQRRTRSLSCAAPVLVCPLCPRERSWRRTGTHSCTDNRAPLCTSAQQSSMQTLVFSGTSSGVCALRLVDGSRVWCTDLGEVGPSAHQHQLQWTTSP